jgi:hypothetical protein
LAALVSLDNNLLDQGLDNPAADLKRQGPPEFPPQFRKERASRRKCRSLRFLVASEAFQFRQTGFYSGRFRVASCPYPLELIFGDTAEHQLPHRHFPASGSLCQYILQFGDLARHRVRPFPGLELGFEYSHRLTGLRQKVVDIGPNKRFQTVRSFAADAASFAGRVLLPVQPPIAAPPVASVLRRYPDVHVLAVAADD